jgi:hypothetical protein
MIWFIDYGHVSTTSEQDVKKVAAFANV